MPTLGYFGASLDCRIVFNVGAGEAAMHRLADRKYMACGGAGTVDEVADPRYWVMKTASVHLAPRFLARDATFELAQHECGADVAAMIVDPDERPPVARA